MNNIPPIEQWKNMISICDEKFECFILKENALGLDKYIEKLYNWSIEQDYNSINDWVVDDYNFTTKYSIIEDQDETGFTFFKVRKLMNDELERLFGEKWNEWKNERISALVYVRVSEEEYDRIKNKKV